MLAVASDHPLADRESVSIEDVADYAVAPITDRPTEMIDGLIGARLAPAGSEPTPARVHPRGP